MPIIISNHIMRFRMEQGMIKGHEPLARVLSQDILITIRRILSVVSSSQPSQEEAFFW